MPEFRLETERLILRDWRDQDWEPFFRHTNNPAVMRWLGGPHDDEAMARVRERLPLVAQEHGHSFWVVERKADGGYLAGEILGFCGLKRANMAGGPMGDFEVGWRLREDAWGRGYAKEAAQASVEAGFARFGAPHIIALTIAEGRNRQVRRMTAAVGFPTLRLVRWSIGEWSLAGIALGEWREIRV